MTYASDDLYIDIDDLPGRGLSASRAAKIRGIPEGKALFCPQSRDKLLNQSSLSRQLSDAGRALNRKYHARLDRDKHGFWVWWTQS